MGVVTVSFSVDYRYRSEANLVFSVLALSVWSIWDLEILPGGDILQG